MKTFAFVTQKGGSGKSTLAVHLAIAASRQGKVALILDLDPQATAVKWAERRKQDGRQPDLAVISARAAELPRLLKEAQQQGADFVVIDTAGYNDVTTRAVIQIADMFLIPCRPSIADIEVAAEMAKQFIRAGRGKNGAFVLNAVQSRGVRAEETREALLDLLPVAPVDIHNLVAFADALNDGRSVEELDTNGKAAEEIRALYKWLISV